MAIVVVSIESVDEFEAVLLAVALLLVGELLLVVEKLVLLSTVEELLTEL